MRFNWFEWVRGMLSGEPEFENLEKYIEIQYERGFSTGFETSLAVSLSGLALGGISALAAFFISGSLLLSAALALGGIAFSVLWMARHNAKLSPDEKAFSQARRRAGLFVLQLRHWKQRRMLRMKLQGGIGELLDAAAGSWLRACSALNEESGASIAWLTARNRALSALDDAMVRLLNTAEAAQRAETTFLIPSFDSARAIAEAMKDLAKEAEKLGWNRSFDRTMETIGPADDLREALADIQRLEAAEQELRNFS